MGVVIVTEEYSWRCTCTSADQAECPKIRPYLAEIGCSDAKVEDCSVSATHQTYEIIRYMDADTPPAMSTKWRAGVAYFTSLPRGGDLELLFHATAIAPPTESNDRFRRAVALAFEQLLFSAPIARFNSESVLTLVGDVVQAAESFGLAARDVLYNSQRSGSILHAWAHYSYLGHMTDSDEIKRAVATGVQTVVGPNVYRQMLRECNADGDTPYDLVCKRHDAASETARAFQLTGPKSAAAE